MAVAGEEDGAGVGRTTPSQADFIRCLLLHLFCAFFLF